MPSPFHLAIPVDDLERCSRFYIDVLGCETGRSDSQWIDLNLFGHQLVLHVDPNHHPTKHHNDVDGNQFQYLILEFYSTGKLLKILLSI